MKNTLIVAVIVIWVCICNAFSKVEISADFDNGHMRPGTKIIEAGENVTITSDLFNTNRDLWFNFKLTGVKDKTIVLTGASQPYRFRESDAEFNIGVAIGALNVLDNGVYVAMNGRVYEWDKCQKLNSGLFAEK